jgi:hypothetical protein
MEVVENFPRDFCEIVKRENFPENLVFNVDETGTFISRVVKSALGFKAIED